MCAAGDSIGAEVKFSAYTQFCDDTAAAKSKSIKDANAAIEQLQADIQKAESDAAVLGKEIAGLEAEIGQWEADKAALTKQRNTERQDYQTTHADYSESTDALVPCKRAARRHVLLEFRVKAHRFILERPDDLHFSFLLWQKPQKQKGSEIYPGQAAVQSARLAGV